MKTVTLPIEAYLVRHGQSEQNVGLSVHPDTDLTGLGRDQSGRAAAQLAACDLRGFAGVVSPYRRARQTAEVIAAATGLQFAVDERVREWGQPVTIDGRAYELEPIDEVVVRLSDFVAAVRGRRLVVVSHGTPIALLTQLIRGERPITAGNFWEGVENCCLRRVSSDRAAPADADPTAPRASP
jgi:broad specificity phosphatase PhoE